LSVALPLVLVALLAAGGYGGVQMFQTIQAAKVDNPWFTGYVDATVTPPYAFEAPVRDSAKNVILSFIVASNDDFCTPSWGTHYSLDAAADALKVDARVAALEAAGGVAEISFGGVINHELSTVCTDPGRLVAAYTAVINRYDITTIDLDIEADDLSNTEGGQRRAVAIKALQENRRADGRDLGVWLTLPVAPFGLTADGKTAVAQLLAAGVDLTGVNAMTMNFGQSRSSGDSMAQASIEALNAAHAQLQNLYSAVGTELSNQETWSRMGATPMVGQNDTPHEVFTLDDAATLNSFAREKGIGRVSMWSLNRDRSCDPNQMTVETVSNACSGVEQGDRYFSDVLGDRSLT
jgi:chitinase